MSNYSKATDFSAKDALLSGNSLKIVSGTEIDDEFVLLATAIGTKVETNNGTHTGTTHVSTLSTGTITATSGVISGATSVTSTTFVGNLTGNVTGNTSGTAATVTTAAQPAITSVSTLTSLAVSGAITMGGRKVDAFDTGTKMLFQQSSSPTGWSKSNTNDNRALRVVTGSVGTGGSNAFTTVFGTGKATSSHTLTAAQSGLPSHRHELSYKSAMDNTSGGESGPNYTGATGDYTDYEGGSAASSGHTHGLTNLDIQYVDVIMATKD